MRLDKAVAPGVVSCFLLAASLVRADNDSIAPPQNAFKDGKPIAFMKSLNEIEPRTAIKAVPYAITNSGAYYVAETLFGSAGISLRADDVDLDLCGFSLKGSGTNSTTGGIVIPREVHNVSIRNGAVLNWLGYGIDATNLHHSQICEIKSAMNGGGGIRVGRSCRVTDCTVVDNRGVGLQATESANIQGCTATGNESNGIEANMASTIIGCTVIDNREHGICVGVYCTIRDCSVVRNDEDGIRVGASCRVEDNNIGDNGRGNGETGAGVCVTGPGNRIRDNNVTANEEGILVVATNEWGGGVGNWIEANNVVDNSRGIKVDGTGNLVIRNCVGTPLNTNNPTHFDIAPGNQYAEILENLGSAFTNANPWANIRLTDE